MRQPNWQRLLLHASMSSPSDAAIAVTVRRLFLTKTQIPTDAPKELLKHIITLSSLYEVGRTPTMWSTLLLRTVWWTAQLLHPCHSWHIKATSAFIRLICCILVECMTEGVSLEGESRCADTYQIHLTHPTAQEALVEALTHVDANELRVALQALEVDKQSQFLPKLEKSV